jgi:endonuclease YncB( thermonuclease family)
MLIDIKPGDYWYANAVAADPGVGRVEYDGDSFYGAVDVGFQMSRTVSRHNSYRLLHLDAPELNRSATKALAIVSRDALDSMIRDRPLIVRTLKDPDNFGRYLIDVYHADGSSVNRWMLDNGYAVPYEG